MPTLKTINGVEPYPKPVKLADDAVFIGRAKICKVVLMDKLASRKHVKIFKIENDYYVEDLKSRNGTFVNGQKLEGIKKLQSGDVIKIGEHEIVYDTTTMPKAPTIAKANAPTAVKPNSDEVFIPSNDVPFGAPGTVYCLNFSGDAGSFTKVLLKPITTVGRGDEADIHIDEMLASRLHCQLEIKAGGLKLVDLESRNGTKVRGEFVNQQYLDKGDEIVIGSTKIIVSSRLPLTTGEYQELKIEEALEKNMDIDQLLSTGDLNQPGRPESNIMEPDKAVPLLQYQLEDGSDRTFSLHKQEVTIGRSDEATLTIVDKLSSRVHAKISRDSNRYFVEDLDSRNGTKINKREVKGKIELLPGDVIQVGEIEFSFILPDEQTFKDADAATAIRSAIQTDTPVISQKKRRKARDRRLRKPMAEPADHTGIIIVIVVIAVVLILALVLILNSENGNTNFPDEPGDKPSDTGNPTVVDRPYNSSSTGNNVEFTSPDDDDDPPKPKDNNTNNPTNKNGDDDDEMTDHEKDEKWIFEAGSRFEEKARREYVNLREKVLYDLLQGEQFGASYVLTTDLIKQYQNKDVDVVMKKLNELLVEIDKQANHLWETYIKPKIKETPEDQRVEQFREDIINWFAGYDKYYEPAMRMIGN